MKRALANRLRSSNTEVSRFLNEILPLNRHQSRRYPDVWYNGAVAEYEDSADYIDARNLRRGRVIA